MSALRRLTSLRKARVLKIFDFLDYCAIIICTRTIIAAINDNHRLVRTEAMNRDLDVVAFPLVRGKVLGSK